MDDLEKNGHNLAELENGSTATKLWKDVKRKRVRIPDLVCLNCGARVESRAKSNKPAIVVSHSEKDAERAWDYGLIPDDIVAFPVCTSIPAEPAWSVGRLKNNFSYWHSQERLRWVAAPHVGYFRVKELRAVPYTVVGRKGATEGSETSIGWKAIFAKASGAVKTVKAEKIGVRFRAGHSYTWQNIGRLPPRVAVDEEFVEHQLIAATVKPMTNNELICPGKMQDGHVASLLASPERTQRFTGVKLARLLRKNEHAEKIRAIGQHPEEDLYVRLEAAAYLVAVAEEPAAERFRPFFKNPDEQARLEAVVALASAGTRDSVDVLGAILRNAEAQYFLRSAAAWALGQIGSEVASAHLIATFSDATSRIREDALEAVSDLEDRPYALLTDTLLGMNVERAAGAAEAIRRYADIPEAHFSKLSDPSMVEREWIVWLIASLPRGIPYIDTAIAEMQQKNPKVHFAMSVLWSFLRSWIAPHWDLNPRAKPLVQA